MAKEKDKRDKIVLVAVLKNKRDLAILLSENWYRIPAEGAPKRQFDYLAFYQPALFGRQGKRILYYARVLNYQIAKRSDLLPKELNHFKASDDYFQIKVGKIKKLPCPVKNIIPRRVSFGFTTLNNLLKSKNILQLYKVAPIEQILEGGLKQAGIKPVAQHYVLAGKKPRSRAYGTLRPPLEAKLLTGRGRRYRLDFAVFCKKGAVAIECDNKKAHSSSRQQEKDKIKTAFLRQHGWIVIRLPEHTLVSDLRGCVTRIKKTIQKLGGVI